MLTTFKATSTSMGGLEVSSEARGFKVTMDEPTDLGGTDKGMNPVEAVLCALGSCLTIVVQAFAHAKGFKCDGVRVELEGDLDPDGFMGKNPDVRQGFQDIRYTVHVKTNETQEKAEEFFDFVSQTCPVCDNLENGVKVTRTAVVRE